MFPLRQISPRGREEESASYPISGTDSSLASIVVMGTPTDPIIGNTLAIEVKHPPQLSVRPKCKQIHKNSSIFSFIAYGVVKKEKEMQNLP